jgi:hypothetical protein
MIIFAKRLTMPFCVLLTLFTSLVGSPAELAQSSPTPASNWTCGATALEVSLETKSISYVINKPEVGPVSAATSLRIASGDTDRNLTSMMYIRMERLMLKNQSKNSARDDWNVSDLSRMISMDDWSAYDFARLAWLNWSQTSQHFHPSCGNGSFAGVFAPQGKQACSPQAFNASNASYGVMWPQCGVISLPANVGCQYRANVQTHNCNITWDSAAKDSRFDASQAHCLVGNAWPFSLAS